MKVAFETVGCKLNQVESDSLSQSFRGSGYSVVPLKSAYKGDSEISLFVFNTCTVTSMAQQKARRLIRLAMKNNPQALLIITGCYAQLDREEILALGENIVIATMEQKAKLMGLPEFLFSQTTSSATSLKKTIKEFLSQNNSGEDPFLFQSIKNLKSSTTVSSLQEVGLYDCLTHSRAMIKIQDGCNCHCNYCRIPLARGKSISLNMEEILKRANYFLDFGYKEIVLTGINISSWNDDGKKLPTLLKALSNLLQKYDGRLRLSSLEPHHLDEEFFDTLLIDNIVPHLHIAFQSLSNELLVKMNRPPITPKVERLLQEYLRQKNNPFLSSDILCGFDGESEADFLLTYNKIKEMGFSSFHIFPFSPREGTVSFVPKNPVSQRVRDERVKELQRLQEECYCNYIKKEDGVERSFLLEGLSKKASDQKGKTFFVAQGLCENYLRPYVEVSKDKIELLKRGEVYKVELLALGNELKGKLLI